jgi:hypothetical protein
MQTSVEKMHQEVLELIATISDGTSSDGASSVRGALPVHFGILCFT